VLHHGLDLVEPDQPYSVAEFRALALTALSSLGDRGGIGILAGGTGFWLRSVFLGIDTDALPSDAVLRAGLETELTSASIAITTVPTALIALSTCCWLLGLVIFAAESSDALTCCSKTATAVCN